MPPTDGAAAGGDVHLAAGSEPSDAVLTAVEAVVFSNIVGIYKTVLERPAGIVAADYCNKQVRSSAQLF